MTQSKLFGFGFGYTAQALARRLGREWRFAGTCRHDEQDIFSLERGLADGFLMRTKSVVSELLRDQILHASLGL